MLAIRLTMMIIIIIMHLQVVSVWIWLKTLHSVTGRKSSTLLELIIGFLRTGSSNRRWRWSAIATNKTIPHSIPALMIARTISTTTTMVIISERTYYYVLRSYITIYVVYYDTRTHAHTCTPVYINQDVCNNYYTYSLKTSLTPVFTFHCVLRRRPQWRSIVIYLRPWWCRSM